MMKFKNISIAYFGISIQISLKQTSRGLIDDKSTSV